MKQNVCWLVFAPHQRLEKLLFFVSDGLHHYEGDGTKISQKGNKFQLLVAVRGSRTFVLKQVFLRERKKPWGTTTLWTLGATSRHSCGSLLQLLWFHGCMFNRSLVYTREDLCHNTGLCHRPFGVKCMLF